MRRGAKGGLLIRNSWPIERWVHDQDPPSFVNGARLLMRTGSAPGQNSDYIGYDLVMADNLPQAAVLVADSCYVSDKIREDIESRNPLTMIPMRKCRKFRKVIDITI